MDWSARASFLTLTFHYSPTVSQSNVAFKRFRTWITRYFPEASFVWRRETQPQRGAIHFHLMCFNLPYIPQWFLQDTWTTFTGEDLSILHIKVMKNRKHGMAYIAKYVAKMPASVGITSLELSPYLHKPKKPSIGRCWGVINADALPFAPVTRLACYDTDLTRQFWILADVLTRGRCGQDAHLVIMFTDSANHMMHWIQEHCAGVLPLDADEGKICYNRHQLQTNRSVKNA
jgi:hypothetical protein